jgi:hypothetical protein
MYVLFIWLSEYEPLYIAGPIVGYNALVAQVDLFSWYYFFVTDLLHFQAKSTTTSWKILNMNY